MTKDQLTPEDRALHDAFFEAYREKFNELVAAGCEPEGDVLLDACTVHAIKAMTQEEERIEDLDSSNLCAVVEGGSFYLSGDLVDNVKCLQGWKFDLGRAISEGIEDAIYNSTYCHDDDAAGSIRLLEQTLESLATSATAITDAIAKCRELRAAKPAPRIVSAVGVGVRVKPPEGE